MITFLDFPVDQGNDPVGIASGRKPMSDDQVVRPFMRLSSTSCTSFRFVSSDDVASSRIGIGIFEAGPRDGNALFFTAGRFGPQFTDIAFVALRKLHVEIVR